VRRSFLATAAALVALGTAASGCGSDNDNDNNDSTSATPAATSSQPAAKAPTGKPIVIGAIGSYTGPEAPALGAMDDTIRVWEKWTNEQGGINGHPVKVIVEDDQTNATKAKQLVRKLVEQDKVQALVGSVSLSDVTWQDYAVAKGIPVIGAGNFNTPYSTNPTFFATGSQIPAMVYGLLEKAKERGIENVGVLPCAEAPVCAEFAKLFKIISGIVGIKQDYTSKITVTQPNYTATCLAARGKGVDGLVVLENAATVVRVADSCAKSGYKPAQLNLTGTVGKVWEGQANLNGAIGTEGNPVLADRSIPATKEFHAALEKHGQDILDGEQLNELDTWVWAAGQVFKLAAERAKVGPDSTYADVKKGLYTFKDETVGGLTPPLTYTKGKPAFTTCWFTLEVVDQKFTAPDGADPSCIPAAKLPALAQALGA